VLHLHEIDFLLTLWELG